MELLWLLYIFWCLEGLVLVKKIIIIIINQYMKDSLKQQLIENMKDYQHINFTSIIIIEKIPVTIFFSIFRLKWYI